MGIELLTKQPVKFYQKDGIKLFERFKAVDKNRNPLELFCGEQNGCNTIFATNKDGIKSSFELSFDFPKRTMNGDVILANPKGQEIGQVLNLAALMTFRENRLNHFKVFSFRESIQFFARYGFKLVTDNVNEILKLLKLVKKSKQPEFESLRRQADFFAPRVSGEIKDNVPYVKGYACEVFSNYLKELSRKGIKFDPDKIPYNAHMDFTDWDFQTENRFYLADLFNKHQINYKM